MGCEMSLPGGAYMSGWCLNCGVPHDPRNEILEGVHEWMVL